MNAGTYPSYSHHFDTSHGHLASYHERRSAYLHDRLGGAHFLGPVLDEKEWASFTIGNDAILQKMWAHEKGLSKAVTAEEVLLKQIENHRTEVFYNLDPLGFGSSFLNKLPGCVRIKLCWRAAPSPGADFGAYDRVMCNFPSIRSKWEAKGWKTASFYPAHDSEMDIYSGIGERPIDISFVGGFSRHHRGRIAVLEAVASLRDRYDIRYHLDLSRITKLAEHPLAALMPLHSLRRSKAIKSVWQEPVFGRNYYRLLGNTKIVLNGSIDMAGSDRGNMRCFEAMGCGGLLVSDVGRYPRGMEHDRTMLTYASPADAVGLISNTLGNWAEKRHIGSNGNRMIRGDYGKDQQWRAFLRVVDEI